LIRCKIGMNAYSLRKRRKTCTFIKIDQVQNRNAHSKLFWIQLIWSYVNGMTILQIHWYIYTSSVTHSTRMHCVFILFYQLRFHGSTCSQLYLSGFLTTTWWGRWYLHCSNIITTLPLTIFPPKLITILA